MKKKSKFPPDKPWTLSHAHKEVSQVAKWAEQMGYINIAPRLAWVQEQYDTDLAEWEAKARAAMIRLGFVR